MILKNNPVLIAGFDVIFFGKKGFSSLAKARRILLRPKGRKSAKWVELDVSMYRTKAEKEIVFHNLMLKMQQEIDRQKRKRKKPQKKKKAPKKRVRTKEDLELQAEIEKEVPPPPLNIQFNKPTSTDRVLNTRRGQKIFIRRYEFKIKKELNFTSGEYFDKSVADQFIQAAKEETKKLFRKYGKTEYLVTILHKYTNFVDYYEAFPEDKPRTSDGKEPADKTFGGFSLNRMEFPNMAVLNEQFDYTLSKRYQSSFSRYLNFANPSTEFSFSGFMVEITVRVLAKVKLQKIKKPKKKKKKK